MVTHRFGMKILGEESKRSIKYIYLKNYNIDEVGRPIVSRDCFSTTDIDNEIDELISELEQIRKMAKR